MARIATNRVRQVLSVFFLIALISVCASTAYSVDDEFTKIKQNIQSQGAAWRAGETSVSQLKPEERRNLLGLIKPDTTDDAWFATVDETLTSAASALPASLDWRSYNGGSYVTPIRDQGNCGGCWAFATAAAMESKFLIAQGSPNVDLDLAEQLLISCSGAGSCAGGYISSASSYLVNVGVPVETCFPYAAYDSSCSNACSNWPSYTYNINGWHWVTRTGPTVDALKSALNTYGPLVTTMDVYTDFFYYSDGIYSMTSGEDEGGHAILLVGYDDNAQCFIAKNSWGTDWGENGYFRVAYSQLNSVVYFGEDTIAYDGQVSPPDDVPDTPTCGTLSSSSASFRHAGGGGRVKVAADGSCPWTASSNASWILVTAGTSGAGSKTVRYKVARNLTASSRAATLTIAGSSFTVTQAARTNTRRR